MSKYAVKEIFLTLQGEGANAGRAAVFCRFSGCNLWSGQEKIVASPFAAFATPISWDWTARAAAAFLTPKRFPWQSRALGSEAKRTGLLFSPAASPCCSSISADRRGPCQGLRNRRRNQWHPRPAARSRLALRQPEGRRAAHCELGVRAEARFPATRPGAGSIVRPRVLAFLVAADGRRRPRREYGGGHRLLSRSPALAAEPANSEVPRHSMKVDV